MRGVKEMLKQAAMPRMPTTITRCKNSLKETLVKRKSWTFLKSFFRQRFTKAIIVLLSVVLGALLLAGLYALMDDTVLPTLTQKIQEMFNYSN